MGRAVTNIASVMAPKANFSARTHSLSPIARLAKNGANSPKALTGDAGADS
jgi:hypothetical protein